MPEGKVVNVLEERQFGFLVCFIFPVGFFGFCFWFFLVCFFFSF